MDDAECQQEYPCRNGRENDQGDVYRAMQLPPRAAAFADGKVGFVVAAHLGRKTGNVVTPASQNLADYRVNANAHKLQANTLGRRVLRGEHQPVLQQSLLRPQCRLRRAPGHLGVVVLLRQVRQYYVRCTFIIVFRKKLGE